MEPEYDLNIEPEENPRSVALLWVVAAVACTFAFTFFYFEVKDRSVVGILVTGLFSAAAIALLVYTIRQTLGQARFGTVRLLLERPAPAVGGKLVASLVVPPGARALVGTLNCTKETCSSRGMKVETVWTGRQSFAMPARAEGGAARIEMQVPAGFYPSTPRPSVISVSPDEPDKVFFTWKLEVTAGIPGVDFDRHYAIRVLPSPAGAPAAAPVAMEVKKEIPQAALQEAEAPDAPREHDHTSVWVLIAANLVPIAGVAFWGWEVKDIVFLYWLENLVVGAFNIPRILLARPKLGGAALPLPLSGLLFGGKLAIAAFFSFHYGFFCYVHGMFLVGMFEGFRHLGSLPAAVVSILRERGMMLALAAIVASRGFSFFRNYIGRREFEGMDVKELMTRPYKRIVVTHIFIIAGGLLLQAFKLPLAALFLFIGLKIAFDAHFHRNERKALMPAPVAA